MYLRIFVQDTHDESELTSLQEVFDLDEVLDELQVGLMQQSDQFCLKISFVEGPYICFLLVRVQFVGHVLAQRPHCSSL